MVKREDVKMIDSIELMNIEKYEFCVLNIKNGKIKIIPKKSNSSFTGLYYHTKDCFFAIFTTINGPTIFFNNKTYIINRNLDIEYTDLCSKGIFKINDYNIMIEYNYSPYLNIDVWSSKKDIDIFYKIFTEYKSDDFYQKYKLK